MTCLQSMLKTLPHLTVITNKHHAQTLGLLFCLLAQGAEVLTAWPKSGGAEEVSSMCSLKKDPLSGKGKGQSWGRH